MNPEASAPTDQGVSAARGAQGGHEQLADIDATLDRLPELSIADQVQVFADIHQRLTVALAGTGGAGAPASDPVSPRDR